MNKLQEKILRLKKEKNAIILAHNYQELEIIEIADYIGDSFILSKKAQEANADMIVFCGVEFMAESAKILNPSKKVIFPNQKAGCFMANKICAEDVRNLRKEYPKAKIMAYINTTAEVKAEVDICCTSSNALKVMESLDADEIIFIPDRNFAEYLQTKTKKKIIPWTKGYCFLHTNLQPETILKVRSRHPEGEILMHPETPLILHKYADHICGTGGMIKYVEKSDKEVFFIATESHMCTTLKHLFQEKTFIPLMRHCTYMGQITLENTLEALQKEEYEIKLNPETERKARLSLEKMMGISK